MFAATPPLEALKMIISIAVSDPGLRIMTNDVRRAYFHAPVRRPVYVELPKEDQMEGEEDMVGELRLSMYGTRDAAQNWQETLSGHLQTAGFKRGIMNPCIFHHEGRGIRTVVHGDDYTSVGSPVSLECLRSVLVNKV